MTENNISHIADKIIEKYGSVENPERSFVSKSIESNVYRTLVNEITATCQLEEITDINEDVSFRYLLAVTDHTWVLELSMVGAFATLMRVTDPKKTSLVIKPGNELEEQLISLLEKYEIQLLSLECLKQRFDFNLNSTDTDKARLYQILFSDIEILPWEISG